MTRRQPLVAIIDETMAAQFWRSDDPVGRRVRVSGRWMTIVGVAAVAKYHNLLETPQPFFYLPLRQNPSAITALQIGTPQARVDLRPGLTCAKSVRSTPASRRAS